MEGTTNTIQVLNPSSTADIQAGRPGHGYGLEIVSDTLQKYHATAAFQNIDGIYSVLLQWPGQQ